MKSGIFFVLKGLMNGRQGVEAREMGPDNAPFLKDGWYFLPKDGDEGVGPFDSEEKALEKQVLHERVRAPGLRILGHVLQPMGKEDFAAFADAPRDALICYTEGATLIWDPTDMCLIEVLGEENGDLSLTETGELERHWTFSAIR